MKLIDAEKIAKWYSETHAMSYKNAMNLLFLKDVAECMPSEDAEPVVHAHWIEDGDNNCDIPVVFYRCSKCGEIADKKYSHCHCGARMDEEVEK